MSQKHRNRERGFTIIELMVVVAIIGVLIGIMIPSLLQARVPAQDKQAETVLRNSLTAAKAVETSDGVSPTQARLTVEDPGIVFVSSSTNPLAANRAVSVANGISGSQWYLVLASHSTSGRCFALLEQPTAAPQFQRIDQAVTCQADQFTPTAGWTTSWP